MISSFADMFAELSKLAKGYSSSITPAVVNKQVHNELFFRTAYREAKNILEISAHVPLIFGRPILSSWSANYEFDLKRILINEKFLSFDDITDIEVCEVILHELQHAKQHTNGDLIPDGPYLCWKNGFKIGMRDMQNLTIAEYNNLPWEKEANNVASVFTPLLKEQLKYNWSV